MEKAKEAKEAKETIENNAHIIRKDCSTNDTSIEDMIDDCCCNIL